MATPTPSANPAAAAQERAEMLALYKRDPAAFDKQARGVILLSATLPPAAAAKLLAQTATEGAKEDPELFRLIVRAWKSDPATDALLGKIFAADPDAAAVFRRACDTAEQTSGGGLEALKAMLTKKVGPLPVWGWGVSVAGVGILASMLFKRRPNRYY